MSNSYNDHKKNYNFPLRFAKKWAKKSVRAQNSRIIANLKKSNDVEEVSDKVFEKDRSGKGDIWNYD